MVPRPGGVPAHRPGRLDRVFLLARHPDGLTSPGDPGLRPPTVGAFRLRILTGMIRRLATEENVLLADVSAAWVAKLQSGTPQDDLHSTNNHPNAAGHRVAADAILAAFVAATQDPE